MIGIAIGHKKDIFPLDGKFLPKKYVRLNVFSEENSDKCLWTEWFDHDTPCNTDGDREVHSEHQDYLMETYTGPLR